MHAIFIDLKRIESPIPGRGLVITKRRGFRNENSNIPIVAGMRSRINNDLRAHVDLKYLTQHVSCLIHDGASIPKGRFLGKLGNSSSAHFSGESYSQKSMNESGETLLINYEKIWQANYHAGEGWSPARLRFGNLVQDAKY